MSNEATVRCTLQIRSGNLNYMSQPSGFTADVTTAKGPTPGAVTVTTFGTDINLSELSTPALCRIMNLDETNSVQWGVFDPETDKFYPVGKCLPGESYVIRLSDNFGEEYEGTGTGTTAATNRLRCKANVASCVVLVEAFQE